MTNILKPPETCIPEDESNLCHVIKGGISVALENDDSEQAIKNQILNSIESIMSADELLSSDREEVVKVNFLGEYEETGAVSPEGDVGDRGGVNFDFDTNDEDLVEVAGAEDGNKKINVSFEYLLIGGACAAMIGILLAILVSRRRKEKGTGETREVHDGVEIRVDGKGSFIEAVSFDLGRRASAMDVHHCTSTTCRKCYKNPPVSFLHSELNANGQFSRDNRNVSISQSDSFALGSSVSGSDSISSAMTEEFF